MSTLASQIATLGPIGRLPGRAALLVADGTGLVIALAAHRMGFILYALLVAAVVFGSSALCTLHRRTPGRSSLDPVLTRVAGALVALGAGAGPWWLIAVIFAGYATMGQLEFPPRKWFGTWLSPEASRVAADVSAGFALLAVATVIAF